MKKHKPQKGKKMSQQVQQTEKNKALVEAASLDAWGGGQTVTANDILVGKILPLQFMSEKVKEKKGEYGEFRDTVFNKKFGDLKAGFEFIPFYMEKKWIEFDVITNKAGAKKKEFKQIIPIVDNPTDPGYNDTLPYVDEENNVERDRVMDFYVLIPSELNDGDALPYILSFKRSSIKAGKKLAMQMFTRNVRKNLSPAAVTLEMTGKTVQNDLGEFVVSDVENKRATTPEELVAAFEWYKIVKSGKTRADNSDLNEEAVNSPGQVNVDESEY